jgi:hypothetical protein
MGNLFFDHIKRCTGGEDKQGYFPRMENLFFDPLDLKYTLNITLRFRRAQGVHGVYEKGGGVRAEGRGPINRLWAR